MNRTARLTSRLVLALGLVALSAAPATAQPNAAARSRLLFDQARELAESKRWAEACPLFQAAHDLNSTGGTALQAANCYEQINKLDRALDLYQFILDNPEARKKADRVALAEERIKAIRARLPPPASTGTAPPPAPTAPPPTTASAPPLAPPLPPPAQPLPPSPALVPPPVQAPPSRVPAFVAFGVGGAGLVVGAVAGGLALAQAGSIKDRCGPLVCLASDAPNRDAAITKGWISTAGFGVGVAGAAVGVVLLVTRGGGSKKVSASADGLVVHF